MITLYGFGRIFPEGIGETKDMRAQWALEETGLPYRVHALDHGAGDLDKDAYVRISPFHQVPVIEDDGFAVAESAAIVLYLAEKAGKLIPADVQGRTRVVQWCFAATSTIGPTLMDLDLLEMCDPGKAAPQLHEMIHMVAGRWFTSLEHHLEGREWIATDEFTVADLMMAGVLRSLRRTNLMDAYPRMKAYYTRCLARPAWQRTLELYAERLGVTVDQIR
jgi:glutathione S-transferase